MALIFFEARGVGDLRALPPGGVPDPFSDKRVVSAFFALVISDGNFSSIKSSWSWTYKVSVSPYHLFTDVLFGGL
jgi:hypothetical protein